MTPGRITLILALSIRLFAYSGGGEASPEVTTPSASSETALSPQPIAAEPVQCVRNIFKYYTAYKLLSEQDTIRQEVKAGTQAED